LPNGNAAANTYIYTGADFFVSAVRDIMYLGEL
jgi:hypothetical protein